MHQMTRVSVETAEQSKWISETIGEHGVSDDALGHLQDKLNVITGVSGPTAVPEVRRAVREVAKIHKPLGINPALTLIKIANEIKRKR